jgi:uncharacterized repeat protein (TIGR03803 family)
MAPILFDFRSVICERISLMTKTLLAGALTILLCSFAAGMQYQVLYNFSGPPTDGQTAAGNPLMDSEGNLYGVTSYGGSSRGCGTNGCGTIYELSPNSQGGWTESILYTFCASGTNCPDGAIPESGLIADSLGNFYGTASGGGNCSPAQGGCGVAFELSPPSLQGGNWTYSVLHAFCSLRKGKYCADGQGPIGGLASDNAGNLYGTTIFGGVGVGIFGQGTIFKLSKSANVWTERVLYKFCEGYNGSYCPDGAQPISGVTIGKPNTLFGTVTLGGSSSDQGAMYKLSAKGTGSTLFVFSNPRAYNAGAPVNLDSAGNAYTTFASGGTGGTGGIVIVNLSGAANVFYYAKAVHGAYPRTGVLVDSKIDMLYGVTARGGNGDSGVVYSLNDYEHETVLHSFCEQPDCLDGEYPSGLSLMPSGTIYGTTVYGGANGLGVVFGLTP